MHLKQAENKFYLTAALRQHDFVLPGLVYTHTARTDSAV